MSHQDWNPLIINNKNNKKSPKPKIVVPDEVIKMNKIENDEYQIPKISLNLQQQIQQARASKGWSQKDLAQRLNVKVDIIRNYESGTAIPDNSLLQRMSRLLGVTLKLHS